jgi:peptidyl-prolyl cis-trans isomerase D
MLKKLRSRKTAKKIWIILTILIVPAFVLWGSGSIIRNKQESGVVGRIFGRKISSSEYKDSLLAVRNQAIIQFGDKLSEVQKYLNLDAQAWERLILLAEAKRRKIKVNDKEVIDLIEKYPFFQRKGLFDQKTYASTLEYVLRTSPRIFEEQTRENLEISQLYNEVTKGVTAGDDEVKREYLRSNQPLSIYYITSLIDDFAKGITISDQEIKDYFTKKSFEFRQPLSFNMEYVSVATADADKEPIQEKIQKIIVRLNNKGDRIIQANRPCPGNRLVAGNLRPDIQSKSRRGPAAYIYG